MPQPDQGRLRCSMTTQPLPHLLTTWSTQPQILTLLTMEILGPVAMPPPGRTNMQGKVSVAVGSSREIDTLWAHDLGAGSAASIFARPASELYPRTSSSYVIVPDRQVCITTIASGQIQGILQTCEWSELYSCAQACRCVHKKIACLLVYPLAQIVHRQTPEGNRSRAFPK